MAKTTKIMGALASRQGVDRLVRFAQSGAPVFVEETRTVSFVFSDGTVDRYGDTIDARGWDLAAFNANPVALFGHDAGSVANVIGKAHNVRVQGNQLIGDIEFATAEENPNAETVYRLVKGGYLNTVSVGFMPKEWTLAKDKGRQGGIDFKKQELMEISVVPIPANPNAIALAKAAGIDVDRLEFLTGARRENIVVTQKGMYSVSELARLLANLGWLADDVEWEAEYEGDGSAVPGKLHDALAMLGQALIDMTIEEVGELLGDDGSGDVDMMLMSADLTPAQKFVLSVRRAAKTETLTGQFGGAEKRLDDKINALEVKIAEFDAAFTKAGKTFSAANCAAITEACGNIIKGHDIIMSMVQPPEADDPGIVEMSAPIVAPDEAALVRTRKAKALKIKSALN